MQCLFHNVPIRDAIFSISAATEDAKMAAVLRALQSAFGYMLLSHRTTHSIVSLTGFHFVFYYF